MTDRVSVGNLRVAQVLYDFVNNEARHPIAAQQPEVTAGPNL